MTGRPLSSDPEAAKCLLRPGTFHARRPSKLVPRSRGEGRGRPPAHATERSGAAHSGPLAPRGRTTSLGRPAEEAQSGAGTCPTARLEATTVRAGRRLVPAQTDGPGDRRAGRRPPSTTTTPRGSRAPSVSLSAGTPRAARTRRAASGEVPRARGTMLADEYLAETGDFYLRVCLAISPRNGRDMKALYLNRDV